MHKKAITLFIFATSVFLSLAVPATRADSTLVAAPNVPTTGPCSGANCFYIVGNGAETATQFSLSGPEFVTTINFDFLGRSQPGIPVTLSLVSALTGSATTFGSFDFTTTSSSVDAFTATLDQNLAAGTYYMLLTASPSGGDLAVGWVDSDGTLIQNAGTVADGQWTGDGTTWVFNDNSNPACQVEGSSVCFPGVFAVNGTPATNVPEPGTMALLGTGLLFLGGRRGRAKRRC